MTRFNIVLLAVLALTVVACSSGAASSATPSSSTSPSASPSPSSSLSLVPVSSPEEAAARAVEVNPELEGIGPKDPDLIGGCCFWEATPTADGWQVVFEVGWGDCQSGCIDRHRWTYSVTRDGAVELVSESGSPPPSGVAGSGGG